MSIPDFYNGEGHWGSCSKFSKCINQLVSMEINMMTRSLETLNY